MRQYRTALVVLPLIAALGACSSSTPKATPTSAATSDPCAGFASNATSIPESCAPSTGPTANASTAPKTTAQIPPLKLPPDPGQLTGGGNDTDASLATTTFSVTVPVGTRLKIHASCLGANHIVIKTQPVSDAESEFNCGFNGIPSEVGVGDPTVAKAPTHYVVTVTTTPPARWWVNIIGTTEPTGGPV